MPKKIILRLHDGSSREIPAPEDQTLAQAVFLAGLWPDLPLCSGLGRCGLCRARYLSGVPLPLPAELRKLTREEVREGWRLACLHPAGSAEVELPRPRSVPPIRRTLAAEAAGYLALAVDLGTTSLHWSALAGEAPVASGQELNPQIGLGGEVMSRLAFAALKPGNREILRDLVLDRLRGLAASLPAPVGSLGLAGNPAMILLALGLNTAGLAQAPYRLDYAAGEVLRLGHGLPEAYIPPLLSPFVGADLASGLAALRFGGREPLDYPFLLADMGTNGEFVLALSETERLCASVPLGPTLEGVGLCFGRTAGPGAVVSFALTPGGILPEYLPEQPDAAPDPAARPGITGTGYLSLAALLLRNGLLDEDGRFTAPATPLGARLAGRLGGVRNEPAFLLDDGLFLPASDVEEILKVKAAFNLAFTSLLEAAGIGPGRLAAVFLAGALGEHAGLDDLERLGFLPPGLKARTRKAGNTSLAGLTVLLAPATRDAAREFAAGLRAGTRLVDLTGEESFGRRYLERMRFVHVS
jgi:uncharacterized 2Fe-2S/4Fe-4S cluster protein (DUF4445 family)/ferredoxin